MIEIILFVIVLVSKNWNITWWGDYLYCKAVQSTTRHDYTAIVELRLLVSNVCDSTLVGSTCSRWRWNWDTGWWIWLSYLSSVATQKTRDRLLLFEWWLFIFIQTVAFLWPETWRTVLSGMPELHNFCTVVFLVE